ncbi:hypothetical protein JCM8547_008653 [Rhodosporidiobolus lusitaniae]
MGEPAEQDAVQHYSSLLEQLATTPYQRDLHLDRIRLAKELSLDDEVEQAREAWTSVSPLNDAEWTEWLEERKAALPPPGTTEDVTSFLEVIELYRRANRDYLSIPLLTAFSRWVISSYYAAHGLAPPSSAADEEGYEDTAMSVERKVGEVDQILSVVFSLDEVREIREEVLKKGGVHLSQSSALWSLWRDFELDLLKMDTTSDQLAAVSDLYLARLSVPHLDIATTFSTYSSFITKYDNDNYSEALPKANSVYTPAAKKSDERFAEEAKLERAGYTHQTYLDYVAWEREVKRPDISLIKALLERAIYHHPREVELWETYIEFLNKIPERESNLADVAERASRNLPENVAMWQAQLRAVEKLGLGYDAVEASFQKAIATGLFANDMDGIVGLYHSRASFYRREMDRKRKEEEAKTEETADVEDGDKEEEANDLIGDLAGNVMGVLIEGIERTKTLHKKGDPQHRLEKYLIRFYERFDMKDEARKLWQELTTTRPTSYALWYAHADFETRMGNYAEAHKIYVSGCSAKGLDYPEYLLDAWMTFETEYGTLSDLEFTIQKTKRQRKGLEKRRAREAAEAAAAAPAPSVDADSFIASAVSAQPVASTSAAAGAGEEDGAHGKKREREDGMDVEGQAKKVRVESPVMEGEPKRDREHSTVFAISPEDVTEEEVRKLFRDCGEIRSLKLKSLNSQTFAQIEFAEKESVLAAQTKDKKRINEQQLEVYVAWQSCLYVTNFPEGFTKETIEALFKKYGTIFDTRWPSKRFKNTRRFCYVQFANPAHAQAALELNGTEFEPGHALSVLISDPSRKKTRSDTNANDRELYISGLSRSVTEDELKKLFEPFGTVKGVRVPQIEDKGGAKGFAFVEFEETSSAQAALSLHNHELKKRHISVTIAQARAVGTAKGSAAPTKLVESVNRGVRVRGLAPGTEEAIIQQTFEKIAPVQRVNFVEGSTEAVVLFENPADVGKVLMRRSSITIDGTPVEVLGEGKQTRTAGGKKPVAAGEGGAVPMMPRQASRGRGRVGLAGGRGRGGRGGIGMGRTAAPAPAASTSGEGSSTGGGGGAAAGGAKSQDDFRAMLMKK